MRFTKSVLTLLFLTLPLLSSCSVKEVQTWFQVRGASVSEADARTLADKVNAQSAGGCDQWYTGACVPNDVADVDCEGGEGDGPAYVAGPFGGIVWDHFDLDRDGNGIACEPRA